MDAAEIAEFRNRTTQWLVEPAYTSSQMDRTYHNYARLLASIDAAVASWLTSEAAEKALTAALGNVWKQSPALVFSDASEAWMSDAVLAPAILRVLEAARDLDGMMERLEDWSMPSRIRAAIHEVRDSLAELEAGRGE